MYRPLLLPVLVLPILICLSAFAQDPSTSYKKLDRALAYDFGNQFGFSVLVADEDDILFTKSYGHLDSLSSKKVNSNALFHIASISKSVTAVGIFMLMGRNQLTLDDTLGKFFRSAPAINKRRETGWLAIISLIIYLNEIVKGSYECEVYKESTNEIAKFPLIHFWLDYPFCEN